MIKKKIAAVTLLAALATSAIASTGVVNAATGDKVGLEGGFPNLTYTADSPEANKLDTNNGATFPAYGRIANGEVIGIDVEGNPIYSKDKYSIEINWKDMLYTYNTGEYDTTTMTWDLSSGKWDNLKQHNEINVINYSSKPVKVHYENTMKDEFKGIRTVFAYAADSNSAVNDIILKSGPEGKDAGTNKKAVYMNLFGNPPASMAVDKTVQLSDVTVTINMGTPIDRADTTLTLDPRTIGADGALAGLTETFTATLSPEGRNENLTWTILEQKDVNGNVVSDNSIAEIVSENNTGKVTYKKAGKIKLNIHLDETGTDYQTDEIIIKELATSAEFDLDNATTTNSTGTIANSTDGLKIQNEMDNLTIPVIWRSANLNSVDNPEYVAIKQNAAMSCNITAKGYAYVDVGGTKHWAPAYSTDIADRQENELALSKIGGEDANANISVGLQELKFEGTCDDIWNVANMGGYLEDGQGHQYPSAEVSEYELSFNFGGVEAQFKIIKP